MKKINRLLKIRSRNVWCAELNVCVVCSDRNPKSSVQRVHRKVKNEPTLRVQNLSLLVQQIKSCYQVSSALYLRFYQSSSGSFGSLCSQSLLKALAVWGCSLVVVQGLCSVHTVLDQASVWRWELMWITSSRDHQIEICVCCVPLIAAAEIMTDLSV